jgi:hypothetical protein
MSTTDIEMTTADIEMTTTGIDIKFHIDWSPYCHMQRSRVTCIERYHLQPFYMRV